MQQPSRSLIIENTHIASWRMLVKRSRKETLRSSSLIWKEVEKASSPDAFFNPARERNALIARRSFDVDSGRAFAASLESLASPSATFSMAESQIKLVSDEAEFISSVYNSFATAKFPVNIACREIRYISQFPSDELAMIGMRFVSESLSLAK